MTSLNKWKKMPEDQSAKHKTSKRKETYEDTESDDSNTRLRILTFSQIFKNDYILLYANSWLDTSMIR